MYDSELKVSLKSYPTLMKLASLRVGCCPEGRLFQGFRLEKIPKEHAYHLKIGNAADAAKLIELADWAWLGEKCMLIWAQRRGDIQRRSNNWESRRLTHARERHYYFTEDLAMRMQQEMAWTCFIMTLLEWSHLSLSPIMLHCSLC